MLTEYAGRGIIALKAVGKSEYGRVYTLDFSADALNRIISAEFSDGRTVLPKYKAMIIEVALADDGEITMARACYEMTVAYRKSTVSVSAEMEMR